MNNYIVNNSERINGYKTPLEILTTNRDSFANATKVVLCSGDSFFCGAGVADHLIDGYPGLTCGIMHPNKEADRWREHVWLTRNNDDSIHRAMCTIENKLNWVGQLRELILDQTVIIINDSLIGSSTSRAERVLKDWILSLRSIYPTLPITVFMGLTDISRFEIRNSETKSWMAVLPSMHFGQVNSIVANNRAIYNAYVEYYTRYGMEPAMDLYRCADSILNVWNLSIVNNIKFSTVTWLKPGQYRQLQELYSTSQYKPVLNKLISNNLWHSYNIYDPAIDYGNQLCCFDGHYSHLVYKDFARRVVNDGKI